MPENSNCSGASSCSKESCEGCPSNAKNKAGGGHPSQLSFEQLRGMSEQREE